MEKSIPKNDSFQPENIIFLIGYFLFLFLILLEIEKLANQKLSSRES